MAKKQEPEQEQERLPVLEIKPSEEVHPRPIWQRVMAFVLIGLLVAATAACAFWQYI